MTIGSPTLTSCFSTTLKWLIRHEFTLAPAPAYSQLESRGEASYKEHNINPVVQTGFTWAVTDRLRLMGDMTVNFPFFRDVKYGENGELDGRFKPANTSFNLGVGYAF